MKLTNQEIAALITAAQEMHAKDNNSTELLIDLAGAIYKLQGLLKKQS